MSTQPEVIRQTDLLNRLVLDRNTTEKLGNVEQLWIDPQAHRVKGLSCKSGLLSRQKQLFNWSQIETIGNDGILLNSLLTEDTIESPSKTELIIGDELWTDAGNKVGKIVDFLLETKTGNIVGYLFVSNGWRGVLDGLYFLEPIAISSVGESRTIVLAAAVENAEQYTEGINQKINQAKELIKDDYTQTKKHLKTAMGKTKETAEQLKDVTQSVTDQAKEKLSEAQKKIQNSPNSIVSKKDTEEETDNVN